MDTYMKKTAIVTGASRGIGRAISLKLAADGFIVIAAARADEEKAADYIEDLANQETDLTSYIIGTIAANEPLLAPGAKITLADASWFCGVTYDDRVKLRKEILDTTNDDLRTAAAALRKAFAEAQSCVVASAEALEQCGITEIKSIA